MRRIFETTSSYSPTLLRLALGVTFLAHGGQKVFGWFGGHGLSATVGFFEQNLGIPVPLGYLAVFTEFFGGLAVLLGLLTRPAALGLAITMVVAAVKVHLPNGFFLSGSGPSGVEYNVALLAMSLALLVSGAGALSLDRLLAGRRKDVAGAGLPEAEPEREAVRAA